MKWKDEYATGDAEIDRQHKALFEFTEEFRDVIDKGYGPSSYEGFLEFLAEYIRIHFGYEESCMAANKCPIAGQNKKEHALFMALVDKETARFGQQGYVQESAVTLLDTIDDWLSSHICRIDTKLKGYV